MTQPNPQYRQRALKAAATRAKNRLAAAADQLAMLKSEVHGIEELPAWLLRHYNQLYTIAYNLSEHARWQFKIGRRRLPAPDSVRICMRFNELVSNSHNCPAGGVQNWRRDPLRPLGYPGFAGRLVWHGNSALYAILGEIGVNVTCGGSGPNSGSYDIIVFTDDWPNITRNRMMAALSGVTDDIYNITAVRDKILTESNSDD